GAAGRVVRLGIGWRRVRRLKWIAAPAGPAQQRRLEHWVGVCGVRRRACLCVSREISALLSAGLSNPFVLLPAGQAEDLTESEIDQIVLHELAHLRRWDDWTALVQRVVQALLFFHPAVHWIARRL